MTRSERGRPLARFHDPFKTRSYYLSALYIRVYARPTAQIVRRIVAVEPEGCAPLRPVWSTRPSVSVSTPCKCCCRSCYPLLESCDRAPTVPTPEERLAAAQSRRLTSGSPDPEDAPPPAC